MSKRRNDNVIMMSKRRRFDVKITLLLHRVSAGISCLDCCNTIYTPCNNWWYTFRFSFRLWLTWVASRKALRSASTEVWTHYDQSRHMYQSFDIQRIISLQKCSILITARILLGVWFLHFLTCMDIRNSFQTFVVCNLSALWKTSYGTAQWTSAVDKATALPKTSMWSSKTTTLKVMPKSLCFFLMKWHCISKCN